MFLDVNASDQTRNKVNSFQFDREKMKFESKKEMVKKEMVKKEMV